ncbi:MAG: hypothetical protein ACJ763_02585 [Bdellovibrionia bacterium]
MQKLLGFTLFGMAMLSSLNSYAGQSVVRDEISGSGFKLIFDSTPIANLTFQLDCMANLIHCDPNAFAPFWKSAGWTADDDSAVREWGELQEKYSGFEVDLPELSKEELRKIGYPLRHRGVNFEQRFRMIEFTAADLTEFRKNTGILMRTEDADKAAAILRRFEPRFTRWWKEVGVKNAEGFVGGFASLMKKDGIIPILEKSAVFYKSRLPESAEISIHFIPLPVNSGHTSGEQIENHGVVEFLSSEKPEDRIDVICHEIFHYFYSLASTQDHASLVSFFVKAGISQAIPAYNLLNESLATAFGNGMVARASHTPEWFQKELAKKKSFYNDEPIDAVAKGILPELDKDLGSSVTLYDSVFLNRYLETVGTILDGQSAAPQLFLRTSAVFYESVFHANYRDFQRKTHTGSTWDASDPESDLVQNKLLAAPHLSGLVLFRPTSLEVLNKWRALIPASKIHEIQRASKAKRSFIYSVERAKNAWIFILVASPGDDAGKLLTKLAEAKQPFVGFMP